MEPDMITLIHPSRGRAELAFLNYENWINKSSGKYNIEHILSLDSDDKELPKYLERFTKAEINSNTCVVEAANKAAEKATGDILIYLSDDFDCPQNWDELIINKTKGEEMFMLKVNDKLQPMDNCVLTIPIMSRKLYNSLGYFFHPEYKSMWVDCDLYFVTKPYMIIAPDLVFEHKHHAHGNDDTYRRSEKNWNQGVDIFNRRSKEFGWGMAFNRLP